MNRYLVIDLRDKLKIKSKYIFAISYLESVIIYLNDSNLELRNSMIESEKFLNNDVVSYLQDNILSILK